MAMTGERKHSFINPVTELQSGKESYQTIFKKQTEQGIVAGLLPRFGETWST